MRFARPGSREEVRTVRGKPTQPMDTRPLEHDGAIRSVPGAEARVEPFGDSSSRDRPDRSNPPGERGVSRARLLGGVPAAGNAVEEVQLGKSGDERFGIRRELESAEIALGFMAAALRRPRDECDQERERPDPFPASQPLRRFRQRTGPEKDRENHQNEGQRASEQDLPGLEMLEVGDLVGEYRRGLFGRERVEEARA